MEGPSGKEDPRKAQLHAMFHRLAGADGEVDAEELQDVLTASLSKGKFSYDVVGGGGL